MQQLMSGYDRLRDSIDFVNAYFYDCALQWSYRSI